MNIKDLIFDTTSPKAIKKIQSGKLKFYLGIDPTSNSLHIGHLSTIVFAKRLIALGNKPIILIGEATAQIGDPSGKSAERELLDSKIIKANTKALSKQIEKYFTKNVLFVNNNTWLSKLSLPIFLRDYGKLFNIASMVKKDIVASRLESGISYTEFTYQVLQAVDFMNLAKKYNCNFQIGGQDQWGNITSGLELIRKTKTKKDVFGVTIPLIKKEDGSKFGKSEAGTIWLDSKKTSPYQMYQFLKNTPDNMVLDLIKRLTFVKENKFKSLQKEVKTNSKARKAQNYLAESVVTFVHSKEDLKKAKEITKILFSGDISKMSYKELISCLFDVPSTKIAKKETNIQDLLLAISAAKSKREAREFINNGSIMLNGKLIHDDSYKVSIQNAFDKKIHVVKRGKRKFFIGKY